VEAMAKFYSVTPGSDLDEFVDAAKKKFPNATGKQRHTAWKATGLFETMEACPRENRVRVPSIVGTVRRCRKGNRSHRRSRLATLPGHTRSHSQWRGFGVTAGH